MNLTRPVPLEANHDLSNFDCGKASLNIWLLKHALQAKQSGSAKTFVVCDADIVGGYYSLSVGQIENIDAPERLRRGMGAYPIPVVILARLAVAQTYQGCAIGRGMLQDCIARTCVIAEHVGVRALLTHPLDEEAARFYIRFGFASSPLHEGQLTLLLKDARKYLR